MINVNEMNLKGVMFDVDGTLLDTMTAWHDDGARYLARFGIEAEPGLGDILFAETALSGAQYLIDHYGLSLSREEVAAGVTQEMEDFYRTEAMPKPGAVALLEALADRNIPMTVVTSTDGRCIDDAFRRLGLHRFFQGIYSAGDMKTTKSEPVIYRAAADRMGTAAAETYLFDDGLYALRAAKSFGYGTVGVYDSVSEADQPAIRRTADYYVNGLCEVVWA